MPIPTAVVFLVYALAAIVSALAARQAFIHGFKVRGWIMVSLFGGALAVSFLYYQLTWSGLIDDLALTQIWVRWALIVNGFAVLGAAIITYIATRRDDGN